MFDLEKAVSAWRHCFAQRRSFLREDLDELERHLRDHIEHLMAEGASEEEAFSAAVQEVGDYEGAVAEYRKVYWGKLKRTGRWLGEAAWQLALLRNYVKIAWRNLRRHPLFSSINIAGLAVGLASCFLIFLFVRDELNYDRFHTKADRIYRVVYGDQLATSAALAPALVHDFPEVERAVRLSRRWGEVLVTHEGRSFYETGFFFADSTVFDIFTFPLLRGNPEAALSRPFSLVITEAAAQKYFGDEDPVGRTLQIEGLWDAHDFEITGVARNVPHNTHFKWDFLASFSTRQDPRFPEKLDSWFHIGDYTYVLLQEGSTARDLKQKLPAFFAKHHERTVEGASYDLQPLTDIHLHSHLEREIEPNSDVRYLYIFSAVALLILIIACINYMNLATARSAHRAREVGVRKVVGAHRLQLVRQFLSESLMLTVLSLLLAVFLVKLTLPAFNHLTEKPLALHLADGPLLLGLLSVSAVVGFLAGSYPAFFLARFHPVRILRGVFRTGRTSALIRNAMVVFQFAVSVALIAGTITIQNQLDYVRNKRLGLDKEQVVVLETRNALRQSYSAFKDELLQYPGIVSVTATNQPLPAAGEMAFSLKPEGAEGGNINNIGVDPDFIEVLDIMLVAGRDLSGEFRAEDIMPVLVNEAAVQAWEWKEPIGKTFEGFSPQLVVVGVVQDFHYQSLREQIEPLVIMKWPHARHVLVRVRPEDLPGTMQFIEQQWKAFGPGTPFEYSFLDTRFDQLYKADERLAQVFGYFSGLAILIACLGLFGLAAFTAEQRTKEIGIRKVLGATAASIVLLLSKDFVKLVVIAFVLAVPAAYLAMHRWLEDFAYRIEVAPVTFLAAGLIALLIAFLTVSYQSVKAARANPVDSLRYE